MPRNSDSDYHSRKRGREKYSRLMINLAGKRKVLQKSFENEAELDDQDIWSMLKVQQCDFYTAAFYLNTISPQRSWTERTSDVDVDDDDDNNDEHETEPDSETSRHLSLEQAYNGEDHPESESTQGCLLDQTALLFARAKQFKDPKNDQYPCPSSAGANVTATAMETETYLDGKEDYVNIYIVKNAGPQDFGDISDGTFASKLQTWFKYS